MGTAIGGKQHAPLWQGSAASVVDLHSLLAGLGPAFVYSQAYDIDANGVIVGNASDSNNVSYAVKWSPVVPGDYNGNGIVDAADYIMWCKTDGTPAGYNTWRTHFGQPAGSGSGASLNSEVPEPAALVLLMIAATGWCLRRVRAA